MEISLPCSERIPCIFKITDDEINKCRYWQISCHKCFHLLSNASAERPAATDVRSGYSASRRCAPAACWAAPIFPCTMQSFAQRLGQPVGTGR